MFLLEHVFDVFRMFLLLPAIKNKTIIQNKTEDRQSVTSFNWARQQTHRNVSNQINLPDSSVSGNSKFWGGLTLLIIHLTYTSRPYISLASFFIRLPTSYAHIKLFWQMQKVFHQVLFYHYCTHQSSLAAKSLQ